MILGRLIMRLLLVPLGAGLAIFVAVVVVIVAHWNRFAALLAANPDSRDDAIMAMIFAGPAIAMIVAVSAMAMMLPAALGVLIAEAFAIRSWMFHAANGALSAWVGSVTMVEADKPYDFYNGPLIVVGAGIAAGFAYWAVAGWSAGFWKPVFARRQTRRRARRPDLKKPPGESPALHKCVDGNQRRGCSARAELAFEPLGEGRDGLGVDHGLVPAADHLEVGIAFVPALAALPAVALQIVGGGGEHVGHAVHQIAPAVAVEIDRVFVIGRRQELRLPEIAGPVAAHFGRRQVAAIDDAQRVGRAGPGTSSVRRQSNASVATERITSRLPS